MALVVPMFVIGLAGSSSAVMLVCAAGWLLELCGLSVLSVQIRAERRKRQP